MDASKCVSSQSDAGQRREASYQFYTTRLEEGIAVKRANRALFMKLYTKSAQGVNY
jgi:hypothetical protein